MEIAVGLLARLLENQKMEVVFPDLKLSASELVECASYRVLCRIREILENDEYTDRDCFERIEQIVTLFEQNGLACGSRHDFG